MFKKLKVLYKVGRFLRKVYNWFPAIVGGSVGAWELLGNAPGVLVLLVSAMLIGAAVGKNVNG